jgi:hypothetical protein
MCQYNACPHAHGCGVHFDGTMECARDDLTAGETAGRKRVRLQSMQRALGAVRLSAVDLIIRG